MGKIQDFIVKNGILPKECVYHTWRDAKNKKGEPTGKIRVLVPPKAVTAMIEYKCPECGNESYKEEAWKRPFSTKCDKCGSKLSVPKMKAEAKREFKGK